MHNLLAVGAAAAGFDVWLPNTRSNMFSRGNFKHSHRDVEYWWVGGGCAEQKAPSPSASSSGVTYMPHAVSLHIRAQHPGITRLTSTRSLTTQQ
jgi:hypothetical protein